MICWRWYKCVPHSERRLSFRKIYIFKAPYFQSQSLFFEGRILAFPANLIRCSAPAWESRTWGCDPSRWEVAANPPLNSHHAPLLPDLWPDHMPGLHIQAITTRKSERAGRTSEGSAMGNFRGNNLIMWVPSLAQHLSPKGATSISAMTVPSQSIFKQMLMLPIGG